MPGGWMTGRELHQWREQYDRSAVVPCDVIGEVTTWARCVASDLPRTLTTARAVFAGPIIETPLLHEPYVAEFKTGSLRLPIGVWRWVLRLAWVTGHVSQRAARDEFRQRVVQAANLIAQTGEDTLVVAHAGMMAYLRVELTRRGFSGPRYRVAEHARLYVFQRSLPAPT